MRVGRRCALPGRCVRQGLWDTRTEVESEQPALLVPVDGYWAAQSIDGHLYRLPMCKNNGNDVGGEESKAQKPRHIPMGDSFLLCDFGGRSDTAVQ